MSYRTDVDGVYPYLLGRLIGYVPAPRLREVRAALEREMTPVAFEMAAEMIDRQLAERRRDGTAAS